MRTLLARDGYDAVTVEGIANLAEVSKQTIYRWWPSKAEILGEALLDGDLPGYSDDLGFTGDLAADLRRYLTLSTTTFRVHANTQLARALIAVTATNPDVGEPLNHRFAGPIIATVAARIEAGKDAGLVRPEVESAAIAELLLAATSYAALQGRPLPTSEIDGIVDVLISGLAPR